MRDGSAALSGLIVVTLLLLGTVVVRSVGPAGKSDRILTVSDHSETRTTPPENRGRVTLDIGVANLRRSLP